MPTYARLIEEWPLVVFLLSISVTFIILSVREWRKPPVPQTSDVVEVSFTRRRSDGSLCRFTLTGEDASRYGYLIRTGTYRRGFDDLLKQWKRTDIKGREVTL